MAQEIVHRVGLVMVKPQCNMLEIWGAFKAPVSRT
jgi:hypothetical protein